MKELFFIFGCQRSGTTAILEFLKSFPEIYVFNESKEVIHRVSSDESVPIRLKSLEDIYDIIKEINKEYVVIKPLVESQNAINILDFFHNSKGFWILRNPFNVSASMIRKWGPKMGYHSVNSILNKTEGWRTEKLSQDSIRLISNYRKSCHTPHDYAALFWFARNSFLNSENIIHHKSLKIVEYDKLFSNNYFERMFNLNFEIETNNFFRKDYNPDYDLFSNKIIDFCQSFYNMLKNQT